MIRLGEAVKITVGRGTKSIPITISIWLRIITRIINGASVSEIQEMLPVGFWPKDDTGHGGVVTPEEYPVPSRFDFLRSLGSIQEIPGISFGRRYNYRAFLIGDKVLAENIGYGNAIYVFRAQYNWRELVRETKFENWLSTHPGFVVRIYHRENWQQKVIAAINNKFYPRSINTRARTAYCSRWIKYHQDNIARLEAAGL